ncbi:DUF6816 family protein [Baaleninema sp.]|uniref:DUF6816 family protein n=1 Tax=Baaleninema sp. TaxID=3101197 RepID=UPI003D0107B0
MAGVLSDRAAAFPHWQEKPPVRPVRGDLGYPPWMEGTWNVTSTLVDAVAPLAPEIVTPGYEVNRRYLDRSLNFQVRFQPQSPSEAKSTGKSTEKSTQTSASESDGRSRIVADRAFNGESIARAYLGSERDVSVRVDPDDPNRQITRIPPNRKLVSVVRGRSSERPTPDRFVATEVSYQVFRTKSQIYLNEVETTTVYDRKSPTRLEGNQMTAIYLSPKDPNYFRANGRPVALYRYRLQLERETGGDDRTSFLF